MNLFLQHYRAIRPLSELCEALGYDLSGLGRLPQSLIVLRTVNSQSPVGVDPLSTEDNRYELASDEHCESRERWRGNGFGC